MPQEPADFAQLGCATTPGGMVMAAGQKSSASMFQIQDSLDEGLLSSCLPHHHLYGESL
jgi:hypothetical protein